MAKLNLNREPMAKQDPKTRGENFSEVALGYNAEQAKAEASRCIQCPKRYRTWSKGISQASSRSKGARKRSYLF